MVAHYSRIKSLKWHLIKLISCSNLSVIDYRYLYHNLRRCSNKSLSLWMGIPTLKATAFFLFLVTVRTYFNIGPKTQIGQNWGSAGSTLDAPNVQHLNSPKKCCTLGTLSLAQRWYREPEERDIKQYSNTIWGFFLILLPNLTISQEIWQFGNEIANRR